MAIIIPGFSTLYNILKRDIELDNTKLEYRRFLAKELYDNCLNWSEALMNAFGLAVKKWEKVGRADAEREIMKLVEDFNLQKINYTSLRSDSPIIEHLLSDKRFKSFAEASVDFYESALDVKRIAYGDIKDSTGNKINSNDAGIQKMVGLWKDEVNRMIKNVNHEWMKVQIIEPK